MEIRPTGFTQGMRKMREFGVVVRGRIVNVAVSSSDSGSINWTFKRLYKTRTQQQAIARLQDFDTFGAFADGRDSCEG